MRRRRGDAKARNSLLSDGGAASLSGGSVDSFPAAEEPAVPSPGVSPGRTCPGLRGSKTRSHLFRSIRDLFFLLRISPGDRIHPSFFSRRMPFPAGCANSVQALPGLPLSARRPLQWLPDRSKMRDGPVLEGGRLPGPFPFHAPGFTPGRVPGPLPWSCGPVFLSYSLYFLIRPDP